MRYLKSFNELLLEKSGLTKLGIPSDVMKTVQKDFALPSELTWKKISSKKDLLASLNGKRLFVNIDIDDIAFISYENDKFTADIFTLDDSSGWGGSYERLERKKISKNEFLTLMSGKSLKYEITSEFSTQKQSERKNNERNKEFETFTTKFKNDFLRKFDYILKSIINRDMKTAKEKVVDKLTRNKVEFDYLMKALKDNNANSNSISLLDEFIMKFEDEYSEFYHEHTDIMELSDLFGYDRVLTSFMLFIYTGKIIKK